MYEYRLTRRGRVVAAVFIIILFSLTSALSMEIIARAKNNLPDNPPVNTNPARRSIIYSGFNEEKPDKAFEEGKNTIEELNETGVNNKAKSTSYSHTDSIVDNTLSVKAEQAYLFKGRKLAFLTFDDGPSKNITPQILDILDKYNIKATFYVIGSLSKNNNVVLKDIATRGHAIGIHTYSHDYKTVYKSVDNFINEIRMTEVVLKQSIGEGFHTRLFRFPGGSFEGYKNQYRNLLEENGYVSIDWNVITGDGEYKSLPPDKLLDRLKATSEGKQQLVVLMHDSSGKQTTVEALPHIIEYLKAQGYEFAVLN